MVLEEHTQEATVKNGILNINWTGAPLSDPQQFVIRQLAVIYLKTRSELEYVDFTHELVEGRIKIKHRGAFGTFAGTFFHVDMGMVRDERWTLDFLLPKGMEDYLFEPDEEVFSFVDIPGGKLCTGRFNSSDYQASEVSLLA